MDTTLTLDEDHFRVVSDKARSAGQTPAAYVQSLIEADAKTFDEILEPIRDGFAGVSDDDLDALFSDALRAVRRQP